MANDNARCLECEVRYASLPRERAPLREGVLPKVNTNRLPWGDYFGEVSGNRARTAPAVDQSHPRSKMRSEKCGDIARAARKNSAAPFVVYSVGTFAASSCIGHVPLVCVIAAGNATQAITRGRGGRLKFALSEFWRARMAARSRRQKLRGS